MCQLLWAGKGACLWCMTLSCKIERGSKGRLRLAAGHCTAVAGWLAVGGWLL